jgi:hypothetical protein
VLSQRLASRPSPMGSPMRMMRVVLVESKHKARKDESPTRDCGDLRRDALT